MQITVFGANGRVGRLVVANALADGNSVTAFVHGNNPFEEDNNLKIVQGDVYSYEDVKTALKGSDCVVSTLGSWSTPKKDILSKGMINIVTAMKESGINRVISLTGAGCRAYKSKPTLVEKISRVPLVIFAPKIVKDAEEHMKILNNSNLNWTVLRSPVMNNRGDKKAYKITNTCPMPWSSINRSSVAVAIIELITNHDFDKQASYIKRTSLF